MKRHAKGTHANSTVATDGKHVVACFGSEGLYCYDFEGKQLWKQSLGVLDSGWFYDGDYQWGFGSSPIIYKNMAIVQCDGSKNSFIAAYRLEDGEQRLADAARRDPVVGHADHRRRPRARGAGDERHQVRPRLRPSLPARNCGGWARIRKSRCRRRSTPTG